MRCRARSCWATAACALGLCALPAHAQQWLTVHGFVEDLEGDLVQVDPSTATAGPHITLQVRVSRKNLRNSYTGKLYRSFTGTAVVDCGQRRAWYERLDYYMQPRWAGPASEHASFRPGEAEMKFRDVQANPVAKVVAAACKDGRDRFIAPRPGP